MLSQRNKVSDNNFSFNLNKNCVNNFKFRFKLSNMRDGVFGPAGPRAFKGMAASIHTDALGTAATAPAEINTTDSIGIT